MGIKVIKRERRVSWFAMSDIAFLLLIFLIITVSIDEKGNITLPKFNYTQETGFEKTIPVVLDKTGDLIVDGDKVPEENLKSYLLQFSQAGSIVINLFADRETEYKRVDWVLSTLKECALFKVVLIANPEDEEN